MSKKKGKIPGVVHLTDERDGYSGIEFKGSTVSLAEQREMIEHTIRESERKLPGSTEKSIEAAIAKFRRDNADLIAEAEAEEKLLNLFGGNNSSN